MVTQAGRNLANSFMSPGGSRAASKTNTAHDAIKHPKAISTTRTGRL
jgi:hypothetical protein